MWFPKVLAQTEVPVPKNVLMSELYAVMAERGAKLLVECISNLPEYLRNAKPQSNENASYGKYKLPNRILYAVV